MSANDLIKVIVLEKRNGILHWDLTTSYLARYVPNEFPSRDKLESTLRKAGVYESNQYRVVKDMGVLPR